MMYPACMTIYFHSTQNGESPSKKTHLHRDTSICQYGSDDAVLFIIIVIITKIKVEIRHILNIQQSIQLWKVQLLLSLSTGAIEMVVSCMLPIMWDLILNRLSPISDTRHGKTSTTPLRLCFSLNLSLFCSLHKPKSLHHTLPFSLSLPLSSLVHPFEVTATGTGSPAAGNSRRFNLNLRKQDGNQMY